MSVKEIIAKHLNNENLFHEVQRQIYKNNAELDRIGQINIDIDVEDVKDISVAVLFDYFLKVKTIGLHFLNLIRNSDHFKDASEHLIFSNFKGVDDSYLDCIHSGTPNEDLVIRIVLEYVIVLHMLVIRQEEQLVHDVDMYEPPLSSNCTTPSKSSTPNTKNYLKGSSEDVPDNGSFCMYCDTVLAESDVTCPVCEADVQEQRRKMDAVKKPLGNDLKTSKDLHSSLNGPTTLQHELSTPTTVKEDGWKNKKENNGVVHRTIEPDVKAHVPENRSPSTGREFFSIGNEEKFKNEISVSSLPLEDTRSNTGDKFIPVKQSNLDNKNTWICLSCTLVNTDMNLQNCRACMTEKDRGMSSKSQEVKEATGVRTVHLPHQTYKPINSLNKPSPSSTIERPVPIVADNGMVNLDTKDVLLPPGKEEPITSTTSSVISDRSSVNAEKEKGATVNPPNVGISSRPGSGRQTSTTSSVISVRSSVNSEKEKGATVNPPNVGISSKPDSGRQTSITSNRTKTNNRMTPSPDGIVQEVTSNADSRQPLKSRSSNKKKFCCVMGEDEESKQLCTNCNKRSSKPKYGQQCKKCQRKQSKSGTGKSKCKQRC